MEHNQQDAQLNLLSGILRLGHEAFERDGAHGVGLHIVNNSRLLFKYDRCCLVHIRKKRSKVVAISGQTTVQSNSEYCRDIRDLVSDFLVLDQITSVTADTVEELGLSNKASQAFTHLSEDGTNPAIVLVPLIPELKEDVDDLYLWVVEFFDGSDSSMVHSLGLLGKHYGQALALKSSSGSSLFHIGARRRKRLKQAVAVILILGFLISLFTVRVNQTVVADCEITSAGKQISYAPFDGVIRQSFFKDGDTVKKGDSIIVYDIEEMLFNLADSRKKEEVIATELDLIRQQSFSSLDKLGRVKLLELRLESKKIDRERSNWYIEHSRINSMIDGVLIIEDPEYFSGKAVKAGDALFEIFKPDKLNVTVYLHESDSSIIGNLRDNFVFFVDTRPEKALDATVQRISPKPMLTDTGGFAYTLKALPKSGDGLVNGMRGVARLQGDKVLLVHYLFRNMLLWWRKL